MQNEANSSIADCGFGIADSERPAARRQGLQGRLYKQSQLAGANACETNPIGPGLGRAPMRRKMQNEPNSRRADMPPPFQYSIIPAFQPDADCAKRSQSGRSFKCKVPGVKSGKPGGESSKSSCFKLYTSNSADGRLCGTNPIPGGRAEAMEVEQTIASAARQSATIGRPHPAAGCMTVLAIRAGQIPSHRPVAKASRPCVSRASLRQAQGRLCPRFEGGTPLTRKNKGRMPSPRGRTRTAMHPRSPPLLTGRVADSMIAAVVSVGLDHCENDCLYPCSLRVYTIPREDSRS